MNLTETTQIAQSIISRACAAFNGSIDTDFEHENVYRFINGDEEHCVSVYIFENIDGLFEAEVDIYDFATSDSKNLKLPLVDETNFYDIIEDGINFITNTLTTEKSL